MSLALEELSERIRTLTPDLVLVEKKMFNGRAFMHRGNMLVCPIKDGTLLVRVGKDGMAAALERPGAAPMVMNGRTMGGFVLVPKPVVLFSSTTALPEKTISSSSCDRASGSSRQWTRSVLTAWPQDMSPHELPLGLYW